MRSHPVGGHPPALNRKPVSAAEPPPPPPALPSPELRATPAAALCPVRSSRVRGGCWANSHVSVRRKKPEKAAARGRGLGPPFQARGPRLGPSPGRPGPSPSFPRPRDVRGHVVPNSGCGKLILCRPCPWRTHVHTHTCTHTLPTHVLIYTQEHTHRCTHTHTHVLMHTQELTHASCNLSCVRGWCWPW